MKEIYETVEMEIVNFESDDIITNSLEIVEEPDN